MIARLFDAVDEKIKGVVSFFDVIDAMKIRREHEAALLLLIKRLVDESVKIERERCIALITGVADGLPTSPDYDVVERAVREIVKAIEKESE